MGQGFRTPWKISSGRFPKKYWYRPPRDAVETNCLTREVRTAHCEKYADEGIVKKHTKNTQTL